MPPKLGNGKICYIEIPSKDIAASAAFYESVFGWTVRTRDDHSVAFDDGVGQVSGTWVLNREPATSGLVVHIMVDDASAVVEKMVSHGGQIVQELGKQHPEITALFSDPSGNVLGIFQEPV